VVLASVRDTGDHLTPLQRTAQRLVCRMADRVLANAGAVRARLVREGYDPARIQVIPNGVDLTRFAAARRPWRGRAELGVAPDAPLVAVAARLDPLKGIEHFVDAAALLARRFPGVVFVVVGAGEPASLLARSARLGLHGRLAFTGHRDDVAELLADAAVSVLPSLSEGHSNSLLESMAAGAPVVATRVGGNVETVADGVTGLLVPPGVPAALAEAIGSLLADPARAAAMGRAGRRRAAERYSVGTMIEATQSLYLDLAGRRRRDERESAGAALRERSQGALAGERT
jgi:glycosyltransferase involved in cell wall biosynthesis